MTELLGNPERLNKVADMIQSHPEHFDMQRWLGGVGVRWDRDTVSECAVATDLFECDTTACIAGWACNLWGGEVRADRHIMENGAAILGLAQLDADHLFTDLSLDTADKAADHLRRMALDAERHQFADAGAHDATTATVGP